MSDKFDPSKGSGRDAKGRRPSSSRMGGEGRRAELSGGAVPSDGPGLDDGEDAPLVDSVSLTRLEGSERKSLTVTEELQASSRARQVRAHHESLGTPNHTDHAVMPRATQAEAIDHPHGGVEVSASAPRVQIRNSTTVVKADRTMVRGRLQMLNVSDSIVYTYLDGPEMTIGRATHMDIVALTEGVSRSHAQFVRHEKGFSIADAGSENGTYVNGKRIEQSDLFDGDIIRLGRLQLRYETVGWTRLRKRRRNTMVHRVEPPLSTPSQGTALTRLGAAFGSAMVGVFLAAWLGNTSVTPPAATPEYWQSRVVQSIEKRAWQQAMDDLEVARVFGLPAERHAALDTQIRQAFVDQKTLLLLSEGMASGLSWKQIRQLADQVPRKSIYADDVRTKISSIQDTFIERWVRDARRLYMAGQAERLDEVLTKIARLRPKHEILAELRSK
ncbi:MAG: FHA domain-containing protein [Myxococcota bacterium]|nr:FHA domain-containing protein [Myxococcota bacterium]